MKDFHYVEDMFDARNSTFIHRKYWFEVGKYRVDVAENWSRITAFRASIRMPQQWIPKELHQTTTEEDIDRLLILV